VPPTPDDRAVAPPWLGIGPVSSEAGLSAEVDRTTEGVPAAAPIVRGPRRVRRWLPSAAVAVSLALCFGGVAVAITPPTLYSRLLPDDGATAVVSVDGRAQQLQQAMLRASETGSAGVAGALLLRDLTPATAASTRYLRASVSPAGIDLLFTVTGDSLALAGVTTSDGGVLLSPAVVLDRTGLRPPADRQPTTAFTSATASTAGVATVTRSTTPEGCDTYGVDLTAPRIRLATTLCPRRGVVDFSASQDGAEIARVTSAGQSLATVVTDTVGRTRTWTRPTAWRPTAWRPTKVDGLGTAPVAHLAAPASAAVLADGTVIAAYGSDVEAYRRDGDALRLAWRAHPGGDVVTVAAAGDVTVIGLGSGRLVAYRPDGVELWTSGDVTEVVSGSIVALREAITFATIDGVVWRLETATGRTLWQRDVGQTINRPVVADERVVMAIDTGGQVYGYVPSGERAFYGSVTEPFEWVGLDEKNVYLARAGTLEAYDVNYSQFVWSRRFAGGVTGLCTTTAGAVVVASAGVSGLDPATGQDVWRSPVADQIGCGAGAVVAVRPNGIEVLGTDGRTALSATLPGLATTGAAVTGAVDEAFVLTARSVIRVGP
jgi:hypothetical protein